MIGAFAVVIVHVVILYYYHIHVNGHFIAIYSNEKFELPLTTHLIVKIHDEHTLYLGYYGVLT